MRQQTQETTGTRGRARRRVGRVAAIAAVVGLAASPNVVHADPLPLPPHNSGAGDSTGAITYSAPVPYATAICRSGITFTLGDTATPFWSSTAFVFNTVISGYAGPVMMTGSGATIGCESYALGGGSMTIALQGYNPTTESTLDCRDNFDPRSSALHGTYTRVGSDMTVVLSGKCLVNKFGTGTVTFVARIQVVPSNVQAGGGVTAPVTSATTAGAFVLAPA